MPHPLAVKYGIGSPSLWDDGKRARARDELRDALGEGGTSSKRLKSEDRIELMRIWLAVIAASNDSPKAPATDPTTAPNRKRYRLSMPKIPGMASLRALRSIMSWADYVFIAILVSITASVIILGVLSVSEVLRVEDVKKDAEDLATWFKSTADERKKEDFQPAACRRLDENNWKQCVTALSLEKGPLHGKINAFQPDRALISRKCDQQNMETIGTIIVEKGTLPAGASTMVYTAIDNNEILNKEFNLRILVCGRGFHMIKVQNDVTW